MATTVYMSVDSGKYATKISKLNTDGTFDHASFKTKMDVGVEMMSLDSRDKTYQVEYEGEKYLLGEQAQTISADTQKAELIHKIATYTAIANTVGNGDHVVLSIGCPISTYLNREVRTRYKDFIAPAGTQINIRVNGKTKMFIIDRVFVFPESSGVVYLNREKYKDKTVGVIDIGGLNANCCIYKNLVPQSALMFTLKAGGNILTKNVMTTLETTCMEGDQIAEYMYDSIMTNGVLEGYDESAGIIAAQKAEHVRKIYKECEKHSWSLKIMPVVFTGGTAQYLKNELQGAFRIVDFDNLDNLAEYKNSDGFLAQTLDKCGKTYIV